MSAAEFEEVVDVQLPGRGKDFLFAVIVRPLMFMFWSFVFWGTFWCVLFVWRCLDAGWAAAIQSATPSGRGAALGYANLATAVLALLVWSIVGWALFVTRTRSSVRMQHATKEEHGQRRRRTTG